MTGYLHLSSSYNNKELVLFTAVQLSPWWNENPILLSQEEEKSINLDHVCKILSNDLSPLKICKLNLEDMDDPLINHIETIYRKSMTEYQNMASLSIEKDFLFLKQQNLDLKKIIQKPTSFDWISLFIRLIRKRIENSFIGFLLKWVTISRTQEGIKKINLQMQKIGSNERCNLLKKIDEMEKKRYEEIKENLQKVVFSLQVQFQNHKTEDAYDKSLLKKIRCYEQIHSILFPGSSLDFDKYSKEIDTSLTMKELSELSYFSSNFKSWLIVNFLLKTNEEASECKSLILKIISFYKNFKEPTLEFFLEKLLKTNNHSIIKKSLLQLKSICEKNFSKSFLQCISTKKKEEYSLPILLSILSDFYNLLDKSFTHQLRDPFPCYDEGGEIYLLRLKELSSNTIDVSLPSMEVFNKKKSIEKIEDPFNEIIEKNDISYLIRKFSLDRNVCVPLSQDYLEEIKIQYLEVIELCKKWHNFSFDKLTSLGKEVLHNYTNNKEKIIALVAIGRIAFFREFKKYLYPEQILTVLGELCHQKCVAQVKTGEGKSFIITLLAFVLAMQGKTVHIVSSSQALSKRDQKTARKLFKRFNIQSSHICEEDLKIEKFQSQVIYGSVDDFKFAILKELLLNISLFPQKNTFKSEERFDCVIVDELDNLTIDTNLNHARLSYPSKLSYNWIYPSIFLFVKNRIKKIDELKLNSAIVLNEFKQFLAQENLLQKIEGILDEKLLKWLQSAYFALYYCEEKINYTVAKSEKKDSSKEIRIVDVKNTGRFQYGCRWQNGIHQFLEIKHGIDPKMESLSPLSLSHVVFYSFYRSIYGLTGTIGTHHDRDEIKNIYDLNSFDVPTRLPCQRDDQPVQIVHTRELYWKAIIQKISICQNQRRPILVLCETIQETENLAKLLKKHRISFELLNEIQQKKEEEILSLAGYPTAVTIATNTAGRGTDIILEKESQQNGGLHVLITFYPESDRVEFQARGRAGRQGEKGSSEMIILIEEIKNIHEPFYLNKIRETLSFKKKTFHIILASLEQYRFDLVMRFFTEIRQFRILIADDLFLNNMASSFTNFNLLNIQESKHNILDQKDLELRNLLNELLTNESKGMSYALFLKKVGEKIIDKCLNLWSVYFIQQVDDLFSEIENFLPEIELKKIHAANDANLKKIMDKMDFLYEKTKSLYTPYLDLSGKGLFIYIKDVLDVNLKIF